MWCSKCHAGSQVARFHYEGEQPRDIVTVDDDENLTTVVKLMKVFRCPQCGLVDTHLTRCPFKVKPGGIKTRDNATKKRRRAEEKEEGAFHAEVESVTSGKAKAMDYSKP